MKIAILFLCSAIAVGQSVKKTDPPKYQIPDPPYTTTYAAPISSYATWSQKIYKDGHYVATFDDPNNLWRCVTSGLVDSGLSEGVVAFTVTCYKVKDIPDERTKKETK